MNPINPEHARTFHFAALTGSLSDAERDQLLSRVEEGHMPICQVCHGVPVTKCVEIGCGGDHRICKGCADRWLRGVTTRNCPLACGGDVTKPPGGFTREKVIVNEWSDSVKLACPRVGCDFQGTACTITQHLEDTCTWRPVTECLNSHKGCSHTVAIGIPWHQMKSGHCVEVCPKRAAKCPFGECEWEGDFDELDDHLDSPHTGAVQQYMRMLNEKQRKTNAELCAVKSELTAVKSNMSAFKNTLAPLVALVPVLKSFLEDKVPTLVAKDDLDPLVDKVSGGKRKRAGKWAPDEECEEVTVRGRRRERKFMRIPKTDYATWLSIKKKDTSAPNLHWEQDMAAAGPAVDDDSDDD